MVKNKKCLSCITKFSYCPDCSKKDALAPAWASEFCGEDCKTIWTTAVQYNLKEISKQEAKEIISAINLQPMDNYVACVQRDLKVILAEEPKPKRTKKIALDGTITEKISVPVVAEITNDNIIAEAEPIKAKSHEVVNKTEE